LFNLENLAFKSPTLEDGMAAFRLIESCPPLDANSSYCNLLQCSHFANTSVAVYADKSLIGFVSAYLIPERPHTLFVWQVATAKQARGLGLASRMLKHILARPQCAAVSYLETTITQDNQASWALFTSLADKLPAELQSSDWMDKQSHFAGQHDSETLIRIGPLTSL
jgi:L-2,4-diaminobutyric acid acetyltransferase